MMKRNRLVMVRLNDLEYERISQRAQQDPVTRYQSGEKNMGGYIRNCALKESGVRDAAMERYTKDLAYQVHKIGVNINQATKKLNSGYGTGTAIANLQENLAALNEKFTKVIEYLEVEYGSHETPKH